MLAVTGTERPVGMAEWIILRCAESQYRVPEVFVVVLGCLQSVFNIQIAWVARRQRDALYSEIQIKVLSCQWYNSLQIK